MSHNDPARLVKKMQKPVDFDQFRTTVKTLGLYWIVVNQSLANNGVREVTEQGHEH